MRSCVDTHIHNLVYCAWRLRRVGAGVIEIRVNAGEAFRLMYIAKYVEGIYVLHVFQKKSRKTGDLDVALARQRLAAVRRERHEGRMR